MENIKKIRNYTIWFVAWLATIGTLAYATESWTIWTLFTNIGCSSTGWCLLWSNIKDWTVTTSKIENNTIQTVDLADWAVTNPKIAANAVTNAKIADWTIQAVDLADWAITNTKIVSVAASKITWTLTWWQITDWTIDTVDLADGAVMSTEIFDYAVMTSKIDTWAVTNAKIANSAVTNDKLAGSISFDKMNYSSWFINWASCSYTSAWKLMCLNTQTYDIPSNSDSEYLAAFSMSWRVKQSAIKYYYQPWVWTHLMTATWETLIINSNPTITWSVVNKWYVDTTISDVVSKAIEDKFNSCKVCMWIIWDDTTLTWWTKLWAVLPNWTTETSWYTCVPLNWTKNLSSFFRLNSWGMNEKDNFFVWTECGNNAPSEVGSYKDSKTDCFTSPPTSDAAFGSIIPTCKAWYWPVVSSIVKNSNVWSCTLSCVWAWESGVSCSYGVLAKKEWTCKAWLSNWVYKPNSVSSTCWASSAPAVTCDSWWTLVEWTTKTTSESCNYDCSYAYWTWRATCKQWTKYTVSYTCKQN